MTADIAGIISICNMNAYGGLGFAGPQAAIVKYLLHDYKL